MRASALLLLTFVLVAAAAGAVDQWTLGVTGGGGWYHQATITNATGTAQAGFAPQWAAGVVVGDDAYRYLGGEFRYVYRAGDLQLKSQSQTATMSGDAHIVHYDFLLYATPRHSRIRPFAASGPAMIVYRGTGGQQAFQPLSTFGLLTNTRQTKPAISFGGGVKCDLTKHAQLRVDFHDYASPFPNKVIAPAPKASIKGWLHDFVPQAGLSYIF